MNNINIAKILIGYLITYLIIFVVTGLPKLLGDDVESKLEFAFYFPLYLTVFPFKILSHYPETVVLIVAFIASVYIMHKKFNALRRLAFIVPIFIAWETIGFLSMFRQAIDF